MFVSEGWANIYSTNICIFFYFNETNSNGYLITPQSCLQLIGSVKLLH